MLIHEFRSGALGKITLELPTDIVSSAEFPEDDSDDETADDETTDDET